MPSTFKVSDQIFDVPDERVNAFLVRFPNATEVQSFIENADTFDVPTDRIEAFMRKVPDAIPIQGKDKLPVEIKPEKRVLTQKDVPFGSTLADIEAGKVQPRAIPKRELSEVLEKPRKVPEVDVVRKLQEKQGIPGFLKGRIKEPEPFLLPEQLTGEFVREKTRENLDASPRYKNLDTGTKDAIAAVTANTVEFLPGGEITQTVISGLLQQSAETIIGFGKFMVDNAILVKDIFQLPTDPNFDPVRQQAAIDKFLHDPLYPVAAALMFKGGTSAIGKRLKKVGQKKFIEEAKTGEVKIPEPKEVVESLQQELFKPEKVEIIPERVPENIAEVGVTAAKPISEKPIVHDKLPEAERVSVFDPIKPRFLFQAQNRGKTIPFKEVVRRIDFGDRAKHRRQGEILEKLRDLKLNKLNEKQSKGLADALERGSAPEYRKVLDEMFFRAKNVGVEITGYTQNYFPRMLNQKTGRKMFQDLISLEKEVSKLRESGTFDDAVLADIINKRIEKKKFSPEITEAVNHLIDTGQATNAVDAVSKLRKFSYNDAFSPFGNLEQPRLLDLPIKYWERDARKVLTRYTQGWGKRLAEVEQFGSKGELAIELRSKIAELDPKEADIAWQMIEAWTGSINRDPTKIWSKGTMNAWEKAVQFEVLTKIGLGTAVIPNITQTFISTLPQAGVFRTTKGAFNLLIPKERKAVRASGAIVDTSMRMFAGFEREGALGALTERVLNAGFTPVNKMNNYIAASTAKVFITDLKKLSEKPGVRQKWAKRKLQEYGLDKKLTDKDISEFMFRFANDSQLLKDVRRDPVLASDPRFKPFFLFKKFGLKQAQLIKDQVILEVKQGNVAPLLRLAAGGYLGGEFVVWARNRIKEGFSGEKLNRDDESMLERIAENYAAVGSFGMMSDVVVSGLFSDFPFKGTVEFATIPVQLQTAEKVWDTLFRFGTEIEDYGVTGAARRAVKPTMRLLGPLATQFAKRLETPSQKKSRIDFIKGKARQRIVEQLSKGNAEAAAREFVAWNDRFPEHAILPEDVSDKKVFEFILRKQVKRVSP